MDRVRFLELARKRGPLLGADHLVARVDVARRMESLSTVAVAQKPTEPQKQSVKSFETRFSRF